MKNLLAVICILFCCACSKTFTDERYTKADYNPVDHFYSKCVLGDVEYCSHYNIQMKSVEMYFVRREHAIISAAENRDTVYIDKESYIYDFEQFKELLIKKSALPRDTTIFKITNNMYCQWEIFDQMYNKYIK